MKYEIGKKFIAEKTSDEFVEVSFKYDTVFWDGAIPLKLRYQGYEVTIDNIESNIMEYYNCLNPTQYSIWKTNADLKWKNKDTQTYKVFNALCTNKWECRVCGPVPLVNPQAASRLRDIKKKGFIIATKRINCQQCAKATIHDILVPLNLNISQVKPELRKPISSKLAKRIFTVLGKTEAFFSQKRSQQELIIDHKFPSQRWITQESENTNSMTDKEIINKFQLLSNQTNLLKSRECDRCVFEGKRGKFLGIEWYYEGDSTWNGNSIDDENGCIGCPWYDIKRWKEEVIKKLEK